MTQYNAHSQDVIVLSAVFGSFALVSVILRLVARSKTKAKYGADDWLAVASLISLLGFIAILVYGASDSPQGVRTDANIMLSFSAWCWL
jgi:hypothetical protein